MRRNAILIPVKMRNAPKRYNTQLNRAIRVTPAPIIANRITNALEFPRTTTLRCQAGGTAK